LRNDQVDIAGGGGSAKSERGRGVAPARLLAACGDVDTAVRRLTGRAILNRD